MVWMLFEHHVPSESNEIVPKRVVDMQFEEAELDDAAYFSTYDSFERDAIHSWLLPGLPDDLVMSCVWPWVVEECSAQDICRYRSVSTSWKAFIANSYEWRALQPLLIGTDRRPPWHVHGLNLDDLMYMPLYICVEWHRENNRYLYDY